jgi:hypothetical protein
MALKTIRRAALFVAIYSLAAVLAYAGQAKNDITGTWIFEVQTDAGTGTPTVTFKQDGEKLTGHYSSATLGEADLTGTVKGNDVTFNFMADLQGNAVPVTYKATIESPTAMKGTIDIGGLAGGTFTGKKK